MCGCILRMDKDEEGQNQSRRINASARILVIVSFHSRVSSRLYRPVAVDPAKEENAGCSKVSSRGVTYPLIMVYARRGYHCFSDQLLVLRLYLGLYESELGLSQPILPRSSLLSLAANRLTLEEWPSPLFREDLRTGLGVGFRSILAWRMSKS